MSDKERKKESTLLSSVLQFDTDFTRALAVSATKESPWGGLRPFMKFLEYSGDGFVWLTVTMIWTLLSHQIEVHHRLLNMFILLILDLVIVGSLKIIVRRKRPSHNKKDMIIAVAVDKFSFPSGHTTRAASVAFYFIFVFPIDLHWILVILAWSFIVSMSRIMLGRHHVLDVVFGYLIGICEFIIVYNYLWMSKETCERLIQPIQEELHI